MAFHDELMKKTTLFSRIHISRRKECRLNIDQLKKDMDSPAVKEIIAANVKLAQDLKLLGTPAFFIGKTDATAAGNINYILAKLSSHNCKNSSRKTAKLHTCTKNRRTCAGFFIANTP